MPGSGSSDQAETVKASAKRQDDSGFAYCVRPVVIELDSRRQTISAIEAQLLLGELGRLPRARYRAAEETAIGLVRGIAGGCAVSLQDDERGALLRAIEGVRARRGLPSGLAQLRTLLLRAPSPNL
jgi:hypothetical protein